MQITLNENDIKKALTGFLISMGINLEGKQVTTTFTAGRKDNGNTATLTIEEDLDETAETPPAAEAEEKEDFPAETETVAEPREEPPLELSEETLVFEDS